MKASTAPIRHIVPQHNTNTLMHNHQKPTVNSLTLNPAHKVHQTQKTPKERGYRDITSQAPVPIPLPNPSDQHRRLNISAYNIE